MPEHIMDFSYHRNNIQRWKFSEYELEQLISLIVISLHILINTFPGVLLIHICISFYSIVFEPRHSVAYR